MLYGTNFGSLWRAPASGTIPKGISGNPNSTCSDAINKSHDIAISKPPPITRPFSAAMTGLFNDQFSVKPAKPPSP